MSVTSRWKAKSRCVPTNGNLVKRQTISNSTNLDCDGWKGKEVILPSTRISTISFPRIPHRPHTRGCKATFAQLANIYRLSLSRKGHARCCQGTQELASDQKHTQSRTKAGIPRVCSSQCTTASTSLLRFPISPSFYLPEPCLA